MNLDTYKSTSVDVIKGSALLEDSDLAVLDQLGDELVDTFQKVQLFRTRTEMDVSVLNNVKHATPDSKYWQAVREQNVMFTELVMLSYEYRKTMINIKIQDREISAMAESFERDLLVVEKDKLEFIAKQQERTAKDRIRELQEWHTIKEELVPHMKFGTENVEAHQLESYTRRFINQTQIMGDGGSIPERQNLLGQLHTSIEKMQEKGTWEDLAASLPTELPTI